MIVAAVAWEHLTDESKVAVSQLLRRNPMYASWTAGIPQTQRDEIAFIRAATWPDDIKGAHGYIRDDNHERPPPGPQASRNIGFGDCLQHRYWHFKDIAFSPDGTPLEQAPAVNAESQMRIFISALADPATSNNVKAYDLTWLIHLVGDVHQPLHATSRFTADLTAGDGGGNGVKIAGSSGSLHGYWDGILGTDTSPTAAISYAAGLPVPPAASASILDPGAWLADSEDLAVHHAYVPPVGADAQPFTPTSGYHDQVLELARSQVSLAGVRLANLINAAHIRVRPHNGSVRACGSQNHPR
jgi:hypothetical protein